MANLESQIRNIQGVFLAEPKRTFPYEDLRRLKLAYPTEFGNLSLMDSVNADLNEYCMFVAGLASGGLRKQLSDPLARVKVARLLQQSFFERYPQYRSLQTIDLSPYPDLKAELAFTEKLRGMLLEAVKEANTMRASRG